MNDGPEDVGSVFERWNALGLPRLLVIATGRPGGPARWWLYAGGELLADGPAGWALHATAGALEMRRRALQAAAPVGAAS